MKKHEMQTFTIEKEDGRQTFIINHGIFAMCVGSPNPEDLGKEYIIDEFRVQTERVRLPLSEKREKHRTIKAYKEVKVMVYAVQGIDELSEPVIYSSEDKVEIKGE